MRSGRTLAILASLALLAGCGSNDDGTIGVAVIGDADGAFAGGLRLSRSAQMVRAATQSGLVAINAQGEVVPALAETWIVPDDGLSYIFRLREGNWPDGRPMTAQSARDALAQTVGALDGTSLGLDLSSIEDIRAMAGRVIEIRLRQPEPYLLQLLAQPELALVAADGGTGSMMLEREGQETLLRFKPPAERGLPESEDWDQYTREIDLRVAPAAEALEMFDAGEVGLVLDGDLGSLPLVETGPLSSGTLRVDTAVGLFGLVVRDDGGLLESDSVREALAMAIDRPALLASYNIGGWTTTTRPVSPGLPADRGQVGERWQDVPIETLREEAARRIAAAQSGLGESAVVGPAQVYVWLGEGPGWDQLFAGLSTQWAEVGVQLVRAQDSRSADLVLLDRVARYASPRWFLNQFHCSLARGLCSEEADALASQAAMETNPNLRQTLYARAEAELTLANVYIPIAAPLRWSLVRGNIEGFAPNAQAFHPLPPLAEIPR